MEDAANLKYDLTMETMEILPPEREGAGGAACLCCGRVRASLDEDGCGICEECLAP
jgi:hypothetical protein